MTGSVMASQSRKTEVAIPISAGATPSPTLNTGLAMLLTELCMVFSARPPKP